MVYQLNGHKIIDAEKLSEFLKTVLPEYKNFSSFERNFIAYKIVEHEDEILKEQRWSEMDTGNGCFKMLNEEEFKEQTAIMNESDQSIFSVGEIVEIKNSRFRICYIKKTGMSLELLPRN